MEVLTPDPGGRGVGWKGAASLQEVSTEGWSWGCGWQWACRAQHLDIGPALKVSHGHSQHFQGQAQEGAHHSPGVPGGVMMGGLQPWEKGPAPSSLGSWGTRAPRVTGQPGLAPVSQSSVLPGGGGESGREVLPRLTVLTPWTPVFAHGGQVPGGGHRVQAASASFSLGRARPAQASGPCRPAAGRGALGSCPVLGSGEQASSPEVPVLPLGLRGGWSPGRDHVGQADPHPHRQRAAQAPPRSLASRSVSLLLLEGWVLPGPSARPPTSPSPPLH